jgi:hypothetical protein
MRKYKITGKRGIVEKTTSIGNQKDAIRIATDWRRAGYVDVVIYTLNETTGEYERK